MLLGWVFLFWVGLGGVFFDLLQVGSTKKVVIHVNGSVTDRYKKSPKYCQCLTKDLTINPKKSMTVSQLLLTYINYSKIP